MLSAKCLLLSCAIVAHHSKQPISFSDQLNTSGNNATDQSLADYNTAGPMARNSYMVSHDVSTGQVSQGAPELATINGVTYQQVPSSEAGYSAMLPYRQGQLGKVTQPPIYTSTPVLKQVVEPQLLAPTQHAHSQSGEGQPRESQSREETRGLSQSGERQHERSQSEERQPRESQSGERQRELSQSGDPVYEVLVTSNRQPRKSYIGSGKELTSSESSGSRLAAGISPDTSPPSAYLMRPADLYNSTQPSFPHLQGMYSILSHLQGTFNYKILVYVSVHQ